jgi:LacI family transcriptional regulator
MAEKKSTIHDIARALNVTASTVSRALNGNTRISEDMRRAIHETAQRLNYEHNHIASALRSGRTNIVGVIVPTANRNFFASVVRGIEAVANASGYNVIICQSNDDPKSEANIIATLLRLRVDGIIVSIAGNTRSFDHYRRVLDKGVPLVLFDRVNEALGGSTVVIDDHLGGFLAAEHLIKQGFRRIAHVSGPAHLNIYKNRYRGYLDALEHYGVPHDPQYVKTGSVDVDDGRRYMSELLALPEPPDALFSSSDFAAVGAMQVLKTHGIALPQAFGLVGFANEPFTSFVDPPLTTVDQHSVEMGAFAARIFLEAMSDAAFVPRKTVLTPTLVVRQSSVRT